MTTHQPHMTTDNKSQVGGLNWFELSGSWFEQWCHVKNGRELVVVRDRNKQTWMSQYAISATEIHLLGWFVGDRDAALEFFSQKIPHPITPGTSQ